MNDMPDHGALYFRMCKVIHRMFGPKGDKLKKMLEARDEKFKAIEHDFASLKREYKSRMISLTKKERVKAAEEFSRKEARYKRYERSYKREELRTALRLLRFGLEPHEVGFFAGFTAMLCFLLGFLVLILAMLVSADTGIVVMGVPIVLIMPVAVYSMIEAYPKILAKRVNVSSLARTPEAINYMVMSMRLSPSLTKAIEFAADNTDEPISSTLKKVLWDIYMRRFNNVEEAFLDFAYGWGDIEDFKRSLYSIRSSALERTDEGLSRSLDKASETILSGTKQRVEAFVSTLTTPTTVLFSLGILLPLIIGAMLPMLSLGALNTGMGIEGSSADVQDTSPLWIILLMDIVFPLVGAMYAYHILGKRPGTSTPLLMNVEGERKSLRNLKLVSLSIGLTSVLGGIVILFSMQHIVGTFLIIWGAGLSIAFYYFMLVRDQKENMKNIREMEEEFPDALFQLGSRIAEGNPVEQALRMTSETMKGSKIGELFERISFHIQITRTTLDDVLFGSDGVLKEFPSRTIKATMKVVVEVTKKDALAAGQTIISISTYLRDMKKIEHEIKTSLKGSVDSMKATGMIFAPLVMGVTVALYFLLSGVFEGFGANAQMIPSYIFVLVIGLYLLFTVMIITYFCTGIEHGADPVERRFQTALGIPIALFIFTITSLVASTGLAS